jgi:hypothetical protein
MSTLTTWFNWRVTPTNDDTLPDIYPLSIKLEDFVKIDVSSIYNKILTDVVERTHGLSDDQQALLWDNCVKSEKPQGLISMLSLAMAEKKDLYIVFDQSINVLREANLDEQRQIEADYMARAESSIGTYISFKNYLRTDMVRLYSALEHCTIAALNKQMNLSKAIQMKLSDLRASTGLVDKAEVVAQGKLLAQGLASGKDAMIDAKDVIETAKPDLTAAKESFSMINQKQSFYLGLPESYIAGIQSGGLGSTGEADTKATERGLKNYFFSIIKPTFLSIFGVSATYKSQDFRQLDQALSALQTFSIIEDDLITRENKQLIINQLLDIDTEGGSDDDKVRARQDTPQDSARIKDQKADL